MDGQYTIDLYSASIPPVYLIGPKAHSLYRLIKLKYLGFQVPKGFVITTNAYDEVYNLEKDNFDKVLKGRSRGFNKTAELIQKQLIIPKLLPYRFLFDVEPAYNSLCNVYGAQNIAVAVRSSAIYEDTKSKSYAGAYESFLNVKGIKALKEKILLCFASAWKYHLLLERLKRNNIPNNASIAIIIQGMVCADVSGVTFTADPLSGDYSKLSINSCWGLGDAIVSGITDSDIFTYDKKEEEFSDIRVGNKHIASRCMKNEGTKTLEVPKKKITMLSLSIKDAHKLANICIGIENDFGCPVDIEWAMSNDELYILQARPITTL